MDNHILKSFESELLFETVVEGLGLFIFENRINCLHVPSFKKLTLHSAEQMRLRILEFYECDDGDFCNIIEFESNADIDPNTREWVANRSTNVTSVSDAIVINGMAQKMIANFYVSMNRPKKPTKFLYNLRGAISWSKEQLENGKQD